MNAKERKKLAKALASDKALRRAILVQIMRSDIAFKKKLFEQLEALGPPEATELPDGEALLLAVEMLDQMGAHGFFVNPA
jgi:hypothetical protein